MGTASIFSGEVFLSTFIRIGSIQPADVEQITTIAWRWLVLAAVIVWTGTLIAEWRLLTTASTEHRSEITSLLLIIAQRQRRQSWLWLSIMFLGTMILFWLRSTQVSPHGHLDELPNWQVLTQFLFSTSEGWGWLARGGLIILASGVSTVASFSAWRHTQRGQPRDIQAGEELHARFGGTGNPHFAVRKRGNKRTFVRSRVSHSGSLAGYAQGHTRKPSPIQRRLQAERRMAHLSIALAGGILFALALTGPSVQGTRLYVTALMLYCVALLALAAWLGGTLFIACVLAPATRVLESGERTQTLVELLQAIKPSITQAFIAISVYVICSVEPHLSGTSTLEELVSTPYGAIISAAVGLMGLAFLLTCYQERRALPHLARMAWLAARGTLMSVMGGMDVSRSLQIGQKERQALADLAERRYTSILYTQTVLGLLILLCLVLASIFAPRLPI